MPCGLVLEVAAALRVTAIAVNLYGVARAFTRRTAVFAALCCRTATGGVLTDFFLLIVSHLAFSSSELELPVVWRSTLAHSAAGLEALSRACPSKRLRLRIA